MVASVPTGDTIAALATPPGCGGIGVIRLSGPLVLEIARQILGESLPPRLAVLRGFRDRNGDLLDRGLALYFPAPGSFTGEDVLELHGHGGPVVMDMLLARTLELGARVAEPGEFSRRAFLNDKLDLAQAEAIADLIDSGSAEAARAALWSLDGEFSLAVHSLTEAVRRRALHVEPAIDFPEEEIDFLADEALRARIDGAIALCTHIAAQARQGALLRDGMTVVIAGRPNAGKSSLLNRLAGYDAAIVTDIPGTTRDVLRERISIDGMPLHIADTAGLREEADVVEAEGIRRAQHEMARADRILYVIDASRQLEHAAIQHELALKGKKTASAFALNGPAGTQSLQGCVMSFAYWNPAMLRQTRLLNAQTGEFVAVRVEALGKEALTVRGQPLAAHRYALHAPEFRIDVWYAADRDWVQLESRTEGGRLLRYLIQ